MKKCSNCKKLKGLAEFSKDSSRPDGVRYKCKECANAINAEYQRNNREKQNAKAKRWRDANPDKSRAAVSKYRKANPEVSLHGNHEYRTRKKNAPRYTVSKLDMKRLYSSSCAYCGATEDITLDHVVPLKRGGSHGIGNLVAACRTCNSSKGAKLLVEWRKVAL